MKRLNAEEIKQVAYELCMSEQEAQCVADIFAEIFANEQHGDVGWKIGLPLNSADDYIDEWENHWHRERSWEEYYNSEKKCAYFSNVEDIFKTLDTFKNYVTTHGIAYELNCGNMIIVVC